MNKDLNKIEYQNWIDNTTWPNQALTKEEIIQVLENKGKIEEYKKNLLQSIIMNFFKCDGIPSNYCWKWRQECTDWSNLYILTKEWLIKVWCGEFNSDTFLNWVYSRYNKEYDQRHKFKECPLPLYVVNQSDSYFAKGKTQALMKNNPQTYLEKYTTLYYKPDNNLEKKQVFSKFDEEDNNKKIEINKNNIIEISDAILLFRNKIISKYNKDLLKKHMTYLQSLTVKELTKYAKQAGTIKNEEEKDLWFTLYNDMWCERCGCAIYDNDAIKSRYNLIQSFDLDKLEFTDIPELNTNNIKHLKKHIFTKQKNEN